MQPELKSQAIIIKLATKGLLTQLVIITYSKQVLMTLINKLELGQALVIGH